MSAELHDSDVLTDFRAAVLTFADEARAAIESAKMKADSALRWFDDEAPAYWHREQLKASDGVASARTALSICRAKTVAGRRSSCIDEKVALNRAKDRDELCRVQRGRTNATAHEMHREADDFRARITALEHYLEGDVPRLMALLHRTSAAIDAYTAAAPAKLREDFPLGPSSPPDKEVAGATNNEQDSREDSSDGNSVGDRLS